MKGRNQKVSDLACQYVVEHKKEIIEQFAGKIQPVSKGETPLAIFMAGSPGAGKTEFSKNFIKLLPNLQGNILRIDADEIRTILPSSLYNGKNAHIVQKAASKGVDKLVDHSIYKDKNFILDGTFTSFGNTHSNIERVIKRGWHVEIWYIYQEPDIAWDFTKKREALEGRRILKSDFIEAFFLAKENVNKMKKEFGASVKVNLAIKNRDNIGLEDFFLNIDKIDRHLEMRYDSNLLEKLLK
ncbi:MAG: zeta toxin family protein [Candidatus Gracilibacteria bacterium]